MRQAGLFALIGLLGAALSAKGLKLSRDVMRLNETLAELKNNFEEYGEGRYFITVMGEPSDSQPWGFQLDGQTSPVFSACWNAASTPGWT